MKTVEILGYNVNADGRTVYSDSIEQVILRNTRDCVWVACLNPHSYAVARNDKVFASALKSADWLVPDGVGTLIAAKILGREIEERITGSDIFECVMSQLNKYHGSVFFLGSTEKTLDLIAKKLVLDYPNIRIVGLYSPAFTSEFSDVENQAMIDAIVNAKPDVLWVGMTAPKQEKWIAAHNDKLPVKFAGAIGAVFDFYTGQVKRSHPCFQRLGLEWLPRLFQEPKRLWRRMLVSAPIFLYDVIRAKAHDFFTSIRRR